MPSIPLTKERFMERVEFELNTGCWLWSGAPGSGGYGTAVHNGKNAKAHRVAWFLFRGWMPPPEIKACHKCDTPACVNPDHLFLGTQADNVADMIAKGRLRTARRCGTKNPMASLSEKQVWEIRHLLMMGKWSQAEIARSYGVSPMTISRISNCETWQHVHLNWPYHPHPLYGIQEMIRDAA